MDGKKYQHLSEQLQSNFEKFSMSLASLQENKPQIASKGMSKVIITTLVTVVGLIVFVSIWGIN